MNHPTLQRGSEGSIESTVVNRLMWRLMPFLFLLYIIAYLDRINVSFAILQMRSQLHLSDEAYGRAAGMFFAGYFFFQVPSNLVLERVGVRRWIAGLMVTWGLISCSMIFIRGPVSFYTLRFFLGAAEAGFFPGMIVYMKHWFPASARARAVAWFMTANPLSGVIGSPISAALLGLHGKGIAGWQWVFLMEGLPAIILGVVVSFLLVDRPQEAAWLGAEQRDWLLGELDRERAQDARTDPASFWRVFVSGRIWLMSFLYFGVAATMYGVTLWLPSVIRMLAHMRVSLIGWTTAVPYIITAAAMVLVGRHSDRTNERHWHAALCGFIGAGSLFLATHTSAPWLVVAGMSLGLIGAQSMAGPFWAMASSGMSGAAAAAAIAMINSIANLGGYFGPYIIGFVRSSNGQFSGGLLAISSVLCLSSVLALVVAKIPRRN